MALPTDNSTATGNPYDPYRNAANSRAAGSRGAGEETPEALRRRADILLDEMMLGAVDMAAGGPVAGHANGSSWAHAEAAPTTPATPNNGAAYWVDASSAAATDALDEAAAAYDGITAPDLGGNGYYTSAEYTSAEYTSAEYTSAEYTSAEYASTEPGAWTQATPVQAADQAANSRTANSRLISAEERYAQVPGAQAAGSAPSGEAKAPSTPVMPGPAQPQPAPGEPPADARPRPADFDPTTPSVIRRTAPTLASTMTVGARAGSRSYLLPRSTEVDAQNAQQEINALMSAIATSLPPGHESVERSRHLLNKAETLLQSDPTRSAEVDYYLNQVRRIVQRSQQTQQWSELYRSRLRIYLGAWLLLSLIVLAALAIYAGPLVEWVIEWFAIPSAGIAEQAPIVAGSAIAGALGASLSALANMGRHKRQEFGYFDRKYGLRGLLLPLLGLLFGALLGAVWAAVYYFTGIDPTQAVWALAVPILIAFLVGFSQEWLYGAR